MNMYRSRVSRSPRPVILPVVSNPEHLRCADRRTHSRVDENPTKAEPTIAPSKREDTLGTLADNAVSRSNRQRIRAMRTERTVTVSPEKLTQTLKAIHGLTEDAVTALVTLKRHS